MQIIIVAWITISTGIFAFAAGVGLTGSFFPATLIAILCSVLVLLVCWKFAIFNFDSSAEGRGLQILSTVAVLAALFQLARLAVFIVDPSQTKYSTFPSSAWEVRHSCMTAYFIAAKVVRQVPDIYDNSIYSSPEDDPAKVRKPRMIGPFGIDVYEYPPPFLLLSQAVNYVTPDFYNHRMFWFGLNGFVILIAMIAIARSLSFPAGTRAILFAPLVLAALPTLNTLQKGNIQLMIVAIAMTAMLLLKKQHYVSGALLLGYATISKLFPGMLVFYMLIKRQWKAAGYTITAGILLALIALLTTGWEAQIAFLRHLPDILGGEAFPAFRNPSATAINLSIPGIVFKLKLFGVPGMTFGVSKIVGWIYTMFLLLVIGFIAQRSNQTGNDSPLLWLGILILATLRSPFLPQSYGNVPATWLLTLVAATYLPNRKTLLIVILIWLSLIVIVPHDGKIDPRALALINALPQTTTIAVAFFSLWRWHKMSIGDPRMQRTHRNGPFESRP